MQVSIPFVSVVACAAWIAGSAALFPKPSEATTASPRLHSSAIAGLDGAVHALVHFEGVLVAGGSFRHANGVRVGSLVLWAGAGWVPLGAPFDGDVYALAVFRGGLIAAGDFVHAGARVVPHIARWNGDAWEAMGGGIEGPVRALAVQGEHFLYAGGRFSRAGGVAAHGVARYWNGTWSPVGEGFDGEVCALVLLQDALVAGGDCVIRGAGAYDRYLACFQADRWLPMAPGIDGPVSSLAVYGVSLVVGGRFSQIDFVTPARGIARRTGLVWAAMGFGFDAGSDVRALVVDGDGVVAGGTFESADLRETGHVARFDGRDWFGLGSGTDAAVHALLASPLGIVAGGAFGRAGDVAAQGVATYCADRWNVLGPTPAAIVLEANGALAGGTATFVATLSADASAVASRVTLERAPSDHGPWRPIASGVPERLVVLVDTAPRPEEAAYRALVHDLRGEVVATSAIVLRHAVLPRTVLRVAGETGLDCDLLLANTGHVRLAVFDVAGRRLHTLVDRTLGSGAHRFTWSERDADFRRAPRGVWFVRLETADARLARRWIHTHR